MFGDPISCPVRVYLAAKFRMGIGGVDKAKNVRRGKFVPCLGDWRWSGMCYVCLSLHSTHTPCSSTMEEWLTSLTNAKLLREEMMQDASMRDDSGRVQV